MAKPSRPGLPNCRQDWVDGRGSLLLATHDRLPTLLEQA